VWRALVFAFALALAGCDAGAEGTRLHGHVRLVLLHTADTHSELFPWRTVLGAADARRGLGAAASTVEVGGLARLATALRRERAAAPRSLHLDSGDLFQGSLLFERFSGEPEVLAFDALGVDAQALGNHELDRGVELVHERYRTLAHFPLLAANYAPDGAGGLSDLLEPFVVLNAAGLRVGVIGVGNTSSVGLLAERPNELAELAEDAAGSVERALAVLRPLVDLVVVVTHLGLDADERLVRATSGIDIVLGGHQHLALDAPVFVDDCGGGEKSVIFDGWGGEVRCVPRRVPIVHSGAYGKFLGRITLELDDDPARLGAAYDPLDAFEIEATDVALIPIGAETPEDPAVAELLASYAPAADDPLAALDVLADAPAPLERNGATGGDSPLGNFVASAARSSAEADVAVIGASSLRHDLPPGAVDLGSLVQLVPFEDPLVRVELPGSALVRVLERAARLAAGRDCRTPVHVAGALVRLQCPCEAESCARVFAPETSNACRSDGDCASLDGACGAHGPDDGHCFAPLEPGGVFSVATSEYLANGASGLFDPIPSSAWLRIADSLSTVMSERLRGGAPCSAPSSGDCSRGCAADLVQRAGLGCDQAAETSACADSAKLCARALAACRYVPCLDASAGAERDGRLRLEAP
jgi:5'-nucleotidase